MKQKRTPKPTDKQMLDWMQNGGRFAGRFRDEWIVTTGLKPANLTGTGTGPTLRAAIRAAMKGGAK